MRRWRIWMSEEAAEAIGSAARDDHPVEVGGVLVGVRVGRRPWVTEAIAVPSEHQTPTYYELPAGARHAAVDAARQRDERLGYIGDWHAHPADVGASPKDVDTMRRLASDRDAGCARPVLLIARRVAQGYEIDAHQFTGRRLRDLRVIAAGRLPAPGSDFTQPPPPRPVRDGETLSLTASMEGTRALSGRSVA